MALRFCLGHILTHVIFPAFSSKPHPHFHVPQSFHFSSCLVTISPPHLTISPSSPTHHLTISPTSPSSPSHNFPHLNIFPSYPFSHLTIFPPHRFPLFIISPFSPLHHLIISPFSPSSPPSYQSLSLFVCQLPSISPFHYFSIFRFASSSPCFFFSSLPSILSFRPPLGSSRRPLKIQNFDRYNKKISVFTERLP